MVAIMYPFIISTLIGNWFDRILVYFKQQNCIPLPLYGFNRREQLRIGRGLNLIDVALHGFGANVHPTELPTIQHSDHNLATLTIGKCDKRDNHVLAERLLIFYLLVFHMR